MSDKHVETLPASMTRRRFLGMTAGAVAAAALNLMPPNLQRALAREPPRPGSLRDIKHVVLMMQENRSFDHYFGTMAGVRGFGDAHALRLPGGHSVFYQPDDANPLGYLLPFHLDTRTSSAQKVPTNNHSWKAQHESWNHGQMNKWLAAHRRRRRNTAPYVMGYYTRDDIPFHFALADLFTVCDAYHCSMMGPTGPNRLYWMTGMVDPGGTLGGPVISNEWARPGFRAFRWTTYAERLERAGISWRVYQPNNSNVLNMLPHFRSFQAAHHDSPLYRKGMRRGMVGEFERDAANDALPSVSWVIPLDKEDEHPDHWPAAGAVAIARALSAIASRPDVWAKTVFILNYDENDGFFDHVRPPTPPPGTPNEFVKGVPIGAGFRVPCFIISPWTVGGYVCSQPFDHTSVLQFLEKWTGVKEPNITDWRRKTFGDLTAAFRFDAGEHTAPHIPGARPELELARREVAELPRPAIPGKSQHFPQQEPGTRQRVPR